jgi:CubicO group peptidase (beta-lactamase class C family)
VPPANKVLANDVERFPGMESEMHIAGPAFCDVEISDSGNGTKLCSKEEVLKGIASRPLAFEPWTRPLYSNTGFDLLGWAIGVAASKRLGREVTMEELLHEDVFGPLEMRNTSFWVSLEERENVAVPRRNVPTTIDWDFTSTFNPYTTSDLS